ncbi:MAG: sugar transferase [Beijerinckiaceae bacterium]|nr:sugar transferase [Beijerinckiaceae bacterium]
MACAGKLILRKKCGCAFEHDLQYVDKWSLWLDIRICFLTVFSRKSYRNAG